MNSTTFADLQEFLLYALGPILQWWSAGLIFGSFLGAALIIYNSALKWMNRRR